MATEAVLHLVVQAYVNGAYKAALRLAESVFGERYWTSVERMIDDHEPTYTEIRDYLVGELEIDYVLACRVAFARFAEIAWYRKERGWL
jgi:hypothetical protein